MRTSTNADMLCLSLTSTDGHCARTKLIQPQTYIYIYIYIYTRGFWAAENLNFESHDWYILRQNRPYESLPLGTILSRCITVSTRWIYCYAALDCQNNTCKLTSSRSAIQNTQSWNTCTAELAWIKRIREPNETLVANGKLEMEAVMLVSYHQQLVTASFTRDATKHSVWSLWERMCVCVCVCHAMFLLFYSFSASVCMFVCLYVCMSVCLCVCKYVGINICRYLCMQVCMYLCV